MMTQIMVKPSFWVDSGIQLSKVRNLYLFKFTDELQTQLDHLNEKKETSGLTANEEAELAGILELDQIFPLLNAKMIAESA